MELQQKHTLLYYMQKRMFLLQFHLPYSYLFIDSCLSNSQSRKKFAIVLYAKLYVLLKLYEPYCYLFIDGYLSVLVVSWPHLGGSRKYLLKKSG